MISNFVAPKFACEDYSWIETGLYLLGLICCNYYRNILWVCPYTLGEEKREGFFFFLGFDRVSVDRVNVDLVNSAMRPL